MTRRTGQPIHLFLLTDHISPAQCDSYPFSDMDLSNSHAAVQNEQADRFAAEALKVRQFFGLD
jgi:hypothetical protein